ncbi:MAG: CsgG/HfaB family protein [Rhodothermales bacterium]
MKRPLFLAVLGALLTVSTALAQTESFDAALAAYQRADFDKAITLFADVADNEALAKGVRKEALQYLGRCYVAKRREGEARTTLENLIDLEPPIIELDPDVEPPPLIRLYYNVRKEHADGYAVERPDPGMQTLAVVDFTNSSIDDAERYDALSTGLSSLMLNQLSGATGLKVIERERIQWLLDELDLQQEAGRVDPATAVRTGKLLGANAVLFGSFIKHGKNLHLSARLVKVETGEILMTDQVEGRADDFFDLANQLSLKVAQGINVSLEETPVGARTETRSLDAMMSYSEGLQLLDSDDYQRAYAKFLEALEFDPGYTRAKTKAESLRPLLAVNG